jgi:integrase
VFLLKVNDLLQDEKVIEWLEILNAHESTMKAYLQAMRDFTNVTSKTPSDLILEARDEVQNGIPKGERKLKGYFIKYRKYLQDKQLADTTISNRITGAKSFYKLFDIDIPILPQHGRKARPKPKKENRVIPTKEDIRDVLKLCDPLEKAILLVGISSGLSSNEIRQLKYQDFRKGYDQKTGITTLDLRRGKTGVDFITYTTPETSHAILDYLEFRGRELKFTTQRRLRQLEKQRLDKDGYLFIVRSVPDSYLETRNEEERKLNDDNIIKIYRSLSEKSKKNTKSGAWNIIRSHNSRKLFNSWLINNGCNPFYVNYWMGHEAGDTTNAYFIPEPSKLKEIYAQYIPFLTIEKALDPEQHPDFIRLKKESETYARAAANATVERSELIELKNEIQKLAKFQNEDHEDRRQNTLMKQVLAIKYSPEYPKDADPSEWLKEHYRMIKTDSYYRERYELYEKMELIEGFTKGEDFQKALENDNREKKKKKEELANIINKLTRKDF